MVRARKRKQVVVRMDDSLYAAIDGISCRNGLTMAAWVRQVLIEKLGYPSGSKDQQQATGGDDHEVTR